MLLLYVQAIGKRSRAKPARGVSNRVRRARVHGAHRDPRLEQHRTHPRQDALSYQDHTPKGKYITIVKYKNTTYFFAENVVAKML